MGCKKGQRSSVDNLKNLVIHAYKPVDKYIDVLL